MSYNKKQTFKLNSILLNKLMPYSKKNKNLTIKRLNKLLKNKKIQKLYLKKRMYLILLQVKSLINTSQQEEI